MSISFRVTGVLQDAHTVTLDEGVPLKPGKVCVVVETLEEESRRPFQEIASEIRARQQARGFIPSTKESADDYLKAERATWDED